MSLVAAEPATKPTIRQILLEQLHPAPWNKERPIDDAFVQSLKDYGQLVTSMVRPHPEIEGEFQIVYGHRRALGLKAAGGEGMRCEIRDLDDEAAEELGALENAQRKGLDWQQQCGLIEGYLERHKDEDAPARIASALGITTGQVKRRARMLGNLSPKWLDAIRDGKLPAWTADHFELLTIFDEKAQESLHKEIQYRAGTMTLAELKEEISDSSKALKSAPWDLDDVTLFAKAGACNGCAKRDDVQVDLLGAVTQDGKRRGASCLDEDCFAKKMAAYTKRKEAALLEKHPDAVKVNEGWGSGPKGALRSFDVTEAKKGDKGAVPAIVHGDGGKVTLKYVKVKKEAKAKAPKDAAAEALEKHRQQVDALALEKLAEIITDKEGELQFTKEAKAVLTQFCLVRNVEMESKDEEKRIRAFASEPVTVEELWEAARDHMVNELDGLKHWIHGRAAENKEVLLFAWMVDVDFEELVDAAEEELTQEPTTAAEASRPAEEFHEELEDDPTGGTDMDADDEDLPEE